MTLRIVSVNEEPPDVTTTKWGPWTHDTKNNWLVLEQDRLSYEIDLNTCETSAATLDWICQIASKAWANAEIVGCLVLAIDEILRPQATMCSFGIESSGLGYIG